MTAAHRALNGAEVRRLLFIEQRDGYEGAKDFAPAHHAVYRKCLLLKRRVLDARGMKDKKPHHATFPQYRRAFIESCIAFRKYPRTVW